MTLDTSSFPAYLRSLNIKAPVNTKPGRLIAGPPAPVLDLVLYLGLGPLIFDTTRNRELVRNLGLNADTLRHVIQRLRARTMWLTVWEELSAPHITAANEAATRGDCEVATQEVRAALTMLAIALSGDGYYFYTPMRHRRKSLWTMRRLFAMLRKLTRARAERITVPHPHGKTVGLLHLPSGAEDLPPQSLPALVALHPLGGDKDSFDYFLSQFRAMGYATFCVDLPAHGENYDGPRLKPDAECVGAAALEKLARHPAIDPNRLGVMGGSMGGFFALRTAAASPLAKACLAFAAPFDMGARAHQMVPGIVDSFAWVVGAATLAEAHTHVQRFHLRDALRNIRCPVGIVHGTQDHICDFTATYAIASRITAPVSVFPLVGADHEAAYPEAPHIAGPGLEWLTQHL